MQTARIGSNLSKPKFFTYLYQRFGRMLSLKSIGLLLEVWSLSLQLSYISSLVQKDLSKLL